MYSRIAEQSNLLQYKMAVVNLSNYSYVCTEGYNKNNFKICTKVITANSIWRKRKIFT